MRHDDETVMLSGPHLRAARFSEMHEDPQFYPDVMDPAHRRSIFAVLSHSNPRASIQAPHTFHVSYLVAHGDKGPPLHSHDYAEIFTVLRGRFRFYWGDRGEHHVDLDAMDTFSVPPGVMRNFHALDGQAMLMCVFDTLMDDPDDGIVLSAPFVESSAPGKYDKFKAGHGREMSSLAMRPHIYRHHGLGEGEGSVRRLIKAGDEAAALHTPHELEMDLVFLGEERVALPCSGGHPVAVVALDGVVCLESQGDRLQMDMADIASIDEAMASPVLLSAGSPAVALVIRSAT